MRNIRHSGQTLVIASLSIVVLVACLGLVIDFGRSYIATQQLVGKVDAATLSDWRVAPKSGIIRFAYNSGFPRVTNIHTFRRV